MTTKDSSLGHTPYNHNKRDYFRCFGIDNNFYNLYDRNITYDHKPYVMTKTETNASAWLSMNDNFISCSKCQTILLRLHKNETVKYKIIHFNHYNEVEDHLDKNDILKYYGSTNFGHNCFSFLNKMRKTEVQSGFLIITDMGVHPTDPFLNIELILNRWSLPKTKTMRNRFSDYRGLCPFVEVKRLNKSMFVMCPVCHHGPIGIFAENLRSTIIFSDEDISIIAVKNNKKSPPTQHHRLVLNKLSRL